MASSEEPAVEITGTSSDQTLKLTFYEVVFRDPVNNMSYEVTVVANRSKRVSFHVVAKKPYRQDDQTEADDGPSGS